MHLAIPKVSSTHASWLPPQLLRCDRSCRRSSGRVIAAAATAPAV